MQVTIEGVVSSDVLGQGEQRTVEHTDYIRGLLRSRLVKVVEWHHPEPASDQVEKPDTTAVVDEIPPVVEEAPKRRRRTARPAEEE